VMKYAPSAPSDLCGATAAVSQTRVA
jgi:hypothetical protein